MTSTKRVLIAQIAPKAPPCFETRLAWLEYLYSASESHKQTRLFKDGKSVVILIENGHARINPQFAYCRDCDAQHSLAMSRAGRCNPKHLIEDTESQHAAHAPAPASA